jgi:hypothetical protein
MTRGASGEISRFVSQTLYRETNRKSLIAHEHVSVSSLSSHRQS